MGLNWSADQHRESLQLHPMCLKNKKRELGLALGKGAYRARTPRLGTPLHSGPCSPCSRRPCGAPAHASRDLRPPRRTRTITSTLCRISFLPRADLFFFFLFLFSSPIHFAGGKLELDLTDGHFSRELRNLSGLTFYDTLKKKEKSRVCWGVLNIKHVCHERTIFFFGWGD